MKTVTMTFLSFLFWFATSCSSDGPEPVEPTSDPAFFFGADLSYVNQVMDHQGVYKENGTDKNPYTVFADNGTNLVRLRLWHNPLWTKEVYGGSGTQLYNDIKDVERAIKSAKENGMKVLLDFHYSDTWADPGKQYIPAAWSEIKSIAVLRDSVYNYTNKTLAYLDAKGLMPDLVQLGNETNCGILYSDATQGFPSCNVCNGQWQNAGTILNAGIKAVRDVSTGLTIKTKILLHVADPKNVEWWFDGIKNNASVSDFDMIGFSYYPLWHTTVGIDDISTTVSSFKLKYNKDIMILETAYPWTTAGKDSYNNAFGDVQAITGYPFTEEGQFALLRELTEEVKDGGGLGIIYWEPAWISSNLKDLWGTGSSWENCTFFNFEGDKIKGMDYMKVNY